YTVSRRSELSLLGCPIFRVRKKGIGNRSSGGAGRKKKPRGVEVALARDSNCRNVGWLSPVSHSRIFGNFRLRVSNVCPERLTAHRSTSSLMATLLMWQP